MCRHHRLPMSTPGMDRSEMALFRWHPSSCDALLPGKLLPLAAACMVTASYVHGKCMTSPLPMCEDHADGFQSTLLRWDDALAVGRGQV